jgi:hypothetical protein
VILDFVHIPVLCRALKNKTFRKIDLFPSSGEGWESPAVMSPLERAKPVQRLRLSLYNGPNRVGVSHSSPEDGNRSIFRNVMSLVFFRILDD